MTGEPREASIIREALNWVWAGREGTNSYVVGEPARTEALAALDALVAQRDEALRDVTWTLDYEGRKPMDTVKLLGDREAVLAVQKLKADKEAAQARVAELTEWLRGARAVRGRMFADRDRAEAAEAVLREIAAIKPDGLWYGDALKQNKERLLKAVNLARSALTAAGEQ